jgi:hypothetical protein
MQAASKSVALLSKLKDYVAGPKRLCCISLYLAGINEDTKTISKAAYLPIFQ